MRSRDGWPGHAALAVVALYGLLLSTFLAATAPIGMPSLGVLCARDGGAPANPSAPPAHLGDCCTLGCGASGVAPPARPSDPASAGLWHAADHEIASPRALPVVATRYVRLPRGPPAV